MTWNYRVIKHFPNSPDSYLSIRAVFYEEGHPSSWTEEDAIPLGDDLDELGKDLDLLREALSKPILVLNPGSRELVELGANE